MAASKQGSIGLATDAAGGHSEEVSAVQIRPEQRIQFLYNIDLTAEDYVKRKASWDASAPACPYHPQGGCELVPHGTYAHKFPAGMRVRRFR